MNFTRGPEEVKSNHVKGTTIQAKLSNVSIINLDKNIYISMAGLLNEVSSSKVNGSGGPILWSLVPA